MQSAYTHIQIHLCKVIMGQLIEKNIFQVFMIETYTIKNKELHPQYIV